MSLVDLKESMRRKSLEALDVVNSDRTPAEKREYLDKINPDIKALGEQIADHEYLDEQRKSLRAMSGAGDKAPPEANVSADQRTQEQQFLKSMGEQFVEADGYKAIATNKGSMFTSGSIDIKATISESASAVIQPTVRPGVLPIMFQRLTVADLMPAVGVSSNSVRVIKESTATNAASTVAEGGVKPASTIIYSQVDEPVRKIATVIKISDEMLADAPYVRGQVDGRLTLFVRITEEAELLSGNGTAPDLTGILNRSGLTAAQAKSSDTAVDAIFKDITKIRVASFLDPDAIVVHPNDWQDIRLSKDQNNQYYGGGPFNYGPYGNGAMRGDMGNLGSVDTLWGLKVVVTTAMTEGTALVGAFAMGAEVYRNGGLTVEATNANEDDFLRNLVALRAEERVGLGVIRPSAFSTVTGI